MSSKARIAKESDHAAIQTLYAQWGRAFKHSVDDLEFVVEEQDHIVASVRLSFENNTFIVRSLFVHENHRGRGFANDILSLIDKELGLAEAYCLCPDYLVPLLAKFDFQKIAGLTAPDFLTDRRDRLQVDDPSVILMKRNCNVQVRPITVDDLDDAMRLIRQFELPAVENLSKNDVRSIFSKIIATGSAVLGAFKNEHLVGTCTVNVCANLSWSGRPYSIVENFIVTKDERKKGIGSYLMLFASRYAASRNCYKIAIMTEDSSLAADNLDTSAVFSGQQMGYQLRLGS